MIKRSSRVWRSDRTPRRCEPGKGRGGRANVTARGRTNTQAYEDTQGRRESAESRLAAARGRRGKGQRRTRRAAAAAKGRSAVAARRVGGAWTALRGMCSLNQASPGAETERNTSLSSEGGAGADGLSCLHQHPRLGSTAEEGNPNSSATSRRDAFEAVGQQAEGGAGGGRARGRTRLTYCV